MPFFSRDTLYSNNILHSGIQQHKLLYIISAMFSRVEFVLVPQNFTFKIKSVNTTTIKEVEMFVIEE